MTSLLPPTWHPALAAALAVAPGPIVDAGSLYLVGDVRAHLVDDPALRDVAGSAG